MGQQHINLGTTATGSDGDTNKSAWTKAEANFTDLYANFLTVAAFNTAIASLKNKLINGDFTTWIRGSALGAAAADRYLADRWITRGVGSTMAPSRQLFALGQTDVPGNPKYFHRCLVASVAGASNFADMEQRIEGVATAAGETVLVTFYAKADAARTIGLSMIQTFGSGGSPSAAVTGIGAQQIALTTVWQRFSVAIAVPSIAGKTLGTDGTDSLRLVFWFDAGTGNSAQAGGIGQQSGTFDIARARVKSGILDADYGEIDPVADDLRCRRFATTSPQYVTGRFSSSTIARFFVRLDVPMRATPTASLNGTSFSVEATQVAIYTATGAAISVAAGSNRNMQIDITATFTGGTPTAGAMAQLNTPDVFLLTSEL